MDSPPLPAAWTSHPPLALIVDRDADTRKLYVEYLKLSACSVDEAEDGREALAKAIARQPDIIVTEARLPGIDGVVLCDLLRHDKTTCNIPILCVTGDARQADRAQTVGADAVLVKPCLPEHILREIHRLLDQSAELRQRSRALREQLSAQIERNDDACNRAGVINHTTLSRSYQRIETTEPPATPPALVCPNCDHPLRYLRSHVGGVSARHPEQWDYFDCGNGCGTFQFRQRTRRLRKI